MPGQCWLPVMLKQLKDRQCDVCSLRLSWEHHVNDSHRFHPKGQGLNWLWLQAIGRAQHTAGLWLVPRVMEDVTHYSLLPYLGAPSQGLELSLFSALQAPSSSSGMRSKCAEMLEGTWLGCYFWLGLNSEVLERMFLTLLIFWESMRLRDTLCLAVLSTQYLFTQQACGQFIREQNRLNVPAFIGLIF